MPAARRLERGAAAGLRRVPGADRIAGSLGAGARPDRARGLSVARRDAGAEGFIRAWDDALALHKAWVAPPASPPRPPRAREPYVTWPAPPPAPDPEEDEREAEESAAQIIKLYRIKLESEREARRAGNITAADLYVRQLTCIEVMLDLSERGQELLKSWQRRGRWAVEIQATPLSLLLDRYRRDYWAERGEPERPPLSPLGNHNEEVAYGETGPNQWSAAQDGPDAEAHYRREKEKCVVRAEAQRLWEEKARAEALAWAAREAGRDDGGGPPPDQSTGD